MSGTIYPSLLSSSPRSHPRRRAKAPYEAAEIELLFSSIKKARSTKRRHDLAALLVVCLATGASGQEAALVRGRDLIGNDDGVAIILRRRRQDASLRERCVVALDTWCDRLLELSAPSGDYLIGGGTTRHSRVYDLCLCSKEGRWPIELDPGRARSTYLVTVALGKNSVPELLESAGVTTLEVYDELLYYMGPAPAR